MPSNEAAERLRERLGLMSEGPQSKRLSDEMLDAALADERKATVERALRVLDAHNWGDNLSRSHEDWRDGESAAAHIRRHLDAEAADA